jgi:hypothetical protein
MNPVSDERGIFSDTSIKFKTVDSSSQGWFVSVLKKPLEIIDFDCN